MDGDDFWMTFMSLILMFFLGMLVGTLHISREQGAIKHAQGKITCQYIEFTEEWECKDND